MATATKSKVARKKATRNDYNAIRASALLPAKSRKAIVIGRNGKMRIARRYALKETDAAKSRKVSRDAGVLQNPYRSGGVYFASVQSLINLGVNKAHSFVDIKKEIEKIMREHKRGKVTAWDKFVTRKPRNKRTGKDVDGRLIQTFYVLQRITGNHPYGEKLRQVLTCVDILVDGKGLPMFRLHTGFANYNCVKPQNDMIRHKKAVVAKKGVAKK